MPFTKFDRYVDRHARSFAERLQSLCRMPSVAARGTGMRAMAEAVEQMMQRVGIGRCSGLATPMWIWQKASAWPRQSRFRDGT